MKMLFETIFHVVIFCVVFNLNYTVAELNVNFGTENESSINVEMIYYIILKMEIVTIRYYFALLPGKISAKCIKNPCRIDGLVPYNGQCYNLWRYGHPCSNNNTYLGISENFQIQCDNSKYLGTNDNQVTFIKDKIVL
ncbi:uncharacterized protein LOC122510065 [Leptopilina heterotoma]|uniref:uncharacterized protein LOC122510065 n=1 Tax=Leptopilina heterotoma TaxID=63436 RepID=UPI001CA94E76|nr:uncharacterized protein LOC122510065 [Leptopilina heterotoma]